MKSLVTEMTNLQLNHRISSSHLISTFRSLPFRNTSFLRFPYPIKTLKRRTLRFSSAAADSTSESTSYRGWDELKFSNDSGESSQLRNFLISIGVNGKQHVPVFILGIVCAFAISRIRVSSIIIFPASILVFVCGFSIGFVRGASVNDGSLFGSSRRGKDENFRLAFEKLKNLLDFLDKLDVKIGNLKSVLEKDIEQNKLDVADLSSYINVIDSIALAALPARSMLRESMGLLGSIGDSNGILVENLQAEKMSHQKPTRKKKEMGIIGFDLWQYFGRLFQESSGGAKPINKIKDSVKREAKESDSSDQIGKNISLHGVEETTFGSASNDNVQKVNGSTSSKSGFDQRGAQNIADSKRKNRILENKKIISDEMDMSFSRLLDSEENSHQANRVRFTNNHSFSLKMKQNSIEKWETHKSLQEETEESFAEEQVLKNSNGAFVPSSVKKGDNEAYKNNFRDERLNTSSNEEELSSSSSSMFTDDVLFDRYLMDSNELLKQARKCFRSRGDEGSADVILYRSAKLLSRAISLKPMSLLAVGQLGNAYLLHGELKLKISRELRTLLTQRDPLSSEMELAKLVLGNQVTSKDEIASTLVNVCEECEELLVEAGRKYRMALSIDGNDVRALYNWGLALSFRAQLIADIGPEAASDADRMYMAAIDKFDAMMSKSNAQTPDALYRWGVALQQRSLLRPGNSKEKVKLLQQAKRLYEDALLMDSDNFLVREALTSCISELNFGQYW